MNKYYALLVLVIALSFAPMKFEEKNKCPKVTGWQTSVCCPTKGWQPKGCYKPGVWNPK